MLNKSKHIQTVSGQSTAITLPAALTPPRPLSIFILSLMLWAIFSLPSVLFGQWFPLDEGVNFKIAQHFQEFLPWIVSPYSGTGRYFPFYWLYNSFEFYLFGTNVAPYYLVQSIVFLVAALLTAVTLHKITGSLRWAALLLIAIYFSSPVAENLNTIGKAEPVTYFLMMCIILAFCHGHVTGRYKGGITGFLVLTSTLFALSIWTKETSIALFGFCMTGIGLSIILGRLGKVKDHAALIRDYLYLLLALIVGLFISKAPYVIFSATAKTASYTDYAITPQLVRENLSFYLHQQPDVIAFGLLALVLLIATGRKLFFNGFTPDRSQVRGYILVMSLLAMAWAYYVVLLAWRWPMPYYMLLPAILFKLCAIYGGYMTIAPSLNRFLRLTLYGVVALSTIYAACYIYYVAASQITYSIVYREALKKYTSTGEKGSLVIESYPFYSEQVDGTWELLLVDTGVDYSVKGIADVLDPAVTSNAEMMRLFNLTRQQIDENIKNLPKRGDYVLVITGSKLATWFLRGVTPYYSEDSLLKTQGLYDMDLVGERQISVPALFRHVWTNRLAAENTSIGYKLYKVVNDGPKFLWGGRYPDGWIGRKATLQVNANYRRPVVIRVSSPAFALPNRVRVSKDGRLIKELGLTDTNEVALPLNDVVQGQAEFQFEVQNAVSPKSIKLNADARELGLRIALDQALPNEAPK